MESIIVTEKLLMVASLPMLMLVLLIGLVVVKSRLGQTTTLSIKGLGISIQFRSGTGDERRPKEEQTQHVDEDRFHDWQ